MTSQKCKLDLEKDPNEFMNLPTNVTGVFYQFHEFFELFHDASRPTWHVAHLNFMKVEFTSSNFMNLENQFHDLFRITWFLFL